MSKASLILAHISISTFLPEKEVKQVKLVKVKIFKGNLETYLYKDYEKQAGTVLGPVPS